MQKLKMFLDWDTKPQLALFVAGTVLYVTGMVGLFATNSDTSLLIILAGVICFMILTRLVNNAYHKSLNGLIGTQREMINYFIDRINEKDLIWADVDEQKAWDAKPLERI